MKINEIFYSIQGEGKWTGLPNIFIRTTGCNLRCNYCDTKYAYTQGEEKTIKEIINEIQKYPCQYICITGGEPLLQKETKQLIKTLIDKDYKICLETNGSININELTKISSLLISMDIKCPSSKMNEKMIPENIDLLRNQDQLKFIIQDKNDYEYAKKIFQDYKPVCTVFFQPVWGTNLAKLAEWIINDKLQVKIGLQLHKIIWGNKRKV